MSSNSKLLIKIVIIQIIQKAKKKIMLRLKSWYGHCEITPSTAKPFSKVESVCIVSNLIFYVVSRFTNCAKGSIKCKH